MEEWQGAANMTIISILFAFMLAWLISLLYSFQRQNLSLNRAQSSQEKSFEDEQEGMTTSENLEKKNVEASAIEGGFSSDSEDWEGLEQSSELEETFTAAASYVAIMAANPSLKPQNDKLLKLYGFYKQATEGQCLIDRPPVYRPGAHAKWLAWKNVGEITSEEAMKQYIDLLSEIQPDWDGLSKEEEGHHQKNSAAGAGPVFSMLLSEEEAENAGSSIGEIHAFAREGDIKGILHLLDSNIPVDQHDGSGRTPLLWAVDRGHLEMVKLLVSKGADINAKDAEGETALHYAVVCEEEEIGKYLVENGADPHSEDKNGDTPMGGCPANWHWMLRN